MENRGGERRGEEGRGGEGRRKGRINCSCNCFRNSVCLSVCQVELCEYVKVGRCVYSVKVEKGNVNLHPERDVQDFNAQMDRDQLCSLVMEVIPTSSCLLFCPTKKSCQNVATLLATCLPQ